jgi:hypothetical protein
MIPFLPLGEPLRMRVLYRSVSAMASSFLSLTRSNCSRSSLAFVLFSSRPNSSTRRMRVSSWMVRVRSCRSLCKKRTSGYLLAKADSDLATLSSTSAFFKSKLYEVFIGLHSSLLSASTAFLCFLVLVLIRSSMEVLSGERSTL